MTSSCFPFRSATCLKLNCVASWKEKSDSGEDENVSSVIDCVPFTAAKQF